MHLLRWRLIGSTVDGLGELTAYVDEDRRGVDVHVGNLAFFLANGRLVYEESEWSLASVLCFIVMVRR